MKKDDGTKQLYLLVHGWNRGKYAVLRHEVDAKTTFKYEGEQMQAFVTVPSASRD